MAFLFTLDDANNPIPLDLDKIAEWDLDAIERKRIVARDVVDGVTVSTVFLGVCTGALFGGSGMFFETMLLETTDVVNRYASWDEAQAGHAAVVAELRQGNPTGRPQFD